MDNELTLLLRKLNERINRLEDKLTQLEYNKLILEERKLPAGLGEFAGKRYSRTADGGVVKEIRIGVCDICGRRSEEFNICVKCGRKLCELCSISFRNEIVCRDCLAALLPLTKQEYKILFAISKGINSPEDLAEFTKIKRNEVKVCIKSLAEKELIENSTFLFFSELKILDKGLEALAVYKQVYGKDEDVIQLEYEVMTR